jgi:hypothetical protein
METVTSSPMRFEYVMGTFVVTCMNLKKESTGEHLGSLHQGTSRQSFREAKRNFWASWKQEMPDYYLIPRIDT